MPNFISEDQIEQALVQKLQHLHGFDVLDCLTEKAEDLNDGSGRANKRDVILAERVREAAIRLNPAIPEAAIESALEKLLDRRQAMTLIAANREIYGLLRDGIPVQFDDAQGARQQEHMWLLDFNEPKNNRYLAVTQLWIKGERGFRRPDVLLYVNGIPLVFIELKNSNIKLRNAYDDNLTTYKAEIPQLFLTNAFCVLSNAIETKVGSITAEWGHFFNWLRADDEKQKIDRAAIREQGISLEGVIEGLLPRQRLLDYVENFILYYKDSSKIIAQNHQFIGVNRAYDAFLRREELAGKLGVFWHTQGSGKSFSMIFYARKIFRKQTGNFTFVVVTDRDDLDGQIYRNFLNTRTVTEAEAAQPKNSEEMRKFLGQHKRVVFTLIQKFRWDKGREYPELSPSKEIIVIVDEAHRTQYKSLAENMRKGLPNANYLAFTGTPLLGRERKTNAWFGGYVSEYNFQQSMDDGATVPLFYEKRVPEVLNQNEGLSEEFYRILEDENLDEAQQAKLEKRFAKEIEVIKRDDRLEKIARDIVYHFPRRGYLGKGLVVSVDKFTAVKMYDKVQRLWKEEIKDLRGRISKSANDIEKRRLSQTVEYMRLVEMAVVVSEDADEERKFADQKLGIKPHRERMNKLDAHGHDIEFNFKDENDPLQLVFVCAMWLTGFDAPTLSTLYLDKPMQGHTLMQTIARANRVTSWKISGVEKRNGEIVDYYNVFRNMKLALKDYAQGGDEIDTPVKEKAELFRLLDDAIEQGLVFCHEKEVALREVLGSDDVFEKLGRFNIFANALLANDEWRKGFNVYENTISSLYEACKPEIMGRGKQSRVREVAAFQYLRGVIDSLIEQTDIDKISLKIAELLDESVVVNDSEAFKVRQYSAEYQIIQKGKTWDLSKINFDKLREEFKQATYKNIEIADLRAFLQRKLELMLQQNATRTDFAQRLQQIIDTYNSGGSSTENYYEDLMKFTEDLRAEDERHIREGLSEDELELFDLLKKDRMTPEETQNVRLAAKSLLHRLLEEQPKVLVQDWYKDTQTQKQVRSAVEKVLDTNLPESYDRVLFREKCDNVFYLMLDYASQGRKWAA
ncbi:type I restriction endonuclease subunit R [Methylomicrobium sp. Wu6]|uniref:type I restriction endonuclease subunit R n=1 Tax=Methylomicrobium sp. Wu6 TaxID=3107928 RepID=UPI002DD65F3A|nr:type I restriction endonuclease subunit R [Methylomicrobium sp. Wu6]MEC4750200.1 type I restriction endonuclease subunit R [Methylomicrobium sp. Wu6]